MPLPLQRYRSVLAVPEVRTALLLGFLVRMPVFTGAVILTLHVVATLDHSYGAAGLVSAAATIAIAVSGPWRGRLLDRVGLRRVVLPSVVVALACWSVAPFVGYWLLLALAALAGLFVIPSFSIIRQAVVAAVPESERRTALSLDAVFVELSFMIGPALGVWAATQWPTSWVLFSVEMLGVAAGALLWVVNPRLVGDAEQDGDDADRAPVRRADWFRRRYLAVCAAAAATTIVLGGTDIAIVAALREFDAQPQIGFVLALWGFGSLLGGLVYGGLHQSISSFWLLGGLAVVTFPMAVASGVPSLAALAFVAGLLCAPTITATVDEVSRVVPVGARGEALGWHGSFMTAGMAIGAPGAGYAIDRFGFAGGFVAVSAVGLVVAVLGSLLARGTRQVSQAEPLDQVRLATSSG